jgi:hypothetical protein
MPQQPRTEMVLILAEAARQGLLTEAVNATGDEVFSAVFTLAHTTIKTALAMGGSVESMREAISQMYALLPPIERVN